MCSSLRKHHPPRMALPRPLTNVVHVEVNLAGADGRQRHSRGSVLLLVVGQPMLLGYIHNKILSKSTTSSNVKYREPLQTWHRSSHGLAWGTWAGYANGGRTYRHIQLTVGLPGHVQKPRGERKP